MKPVKASVILEEGIVKLRKECEKHGVYTHRHSWDSEDLYCRISSYPSIKGGQAYGIVLNLTNSCNLDCSFCYSKANDFKLPELDMISIKRILKDYPGKVVYLSGGEPTVCKELTSIIETLVRMGRTVVLFTNGINLTDPVYVNKLKAAGVSLVILQFDSLEDDFYLKNRGRSLLPQKIKALENLRKNGIPVYLFTMLVDPDNTFQIRPLIEFTLKNNDFIKIINFNPVWNMGRTGQHEEFGSSSILSRIEEQTGLGQDDFLESNEFIFYLFHILGRMFMKKTNLHPKCEIRCYVTVDNGRLVPISKLLDIKRLNRALRTIIGNGKGGPLILLGLILYLPFFFFSLTASFIKNRPLRRAIGRMAKGLFVKRTVIAMFPFTSVIIGTFQNIGNIDLDLQETCNLYSELRPYSDRRCSACLRQIFFDRLSLGKEDPSGVDTKLNNLNESDGTGKPGKNHVHAEKDRNI